MPLVAMNGNVGELAQLALINEQGMYGGLDGMNLGHLAAAKASQQQRQADKQAAQQQRQAEAESRKAQQQAEAEARRAQQQAAQQQRQAEAEARKAQQQAEAAARQQAQQQQRAQQQAAQQAAQQQRQAEAAARQQAQQQQRAQQQAAQQAAQQQRQAEAAARQQAQQQQRAQQQATQQAKQQAAQQQRAQQQAAQQAKQQATQQQHAQQQAQQQAAAQQRKDAAAAQKAQQQAAQQQKKDATAAQKAQQQQNALVKKADKATTAQQKKEAAATKKQDQQQARCKAPRVWDEKTKKCLGKNKAGKPISDEQDSKNAGALKKVSEAAKAQAIKLYNAALQKNPKAALRIAQKYPQVLNVSEAQKAVQAQGQKGATPKYPSGPTTSPRKPPMPPGKKLVGYGMGYGLGDDAMIDPTLAAAGMTDPAMSMQQVMMSMNQPTPPKGCDKNPNKPVCLMYNMSTQNQQMMMMVMQQVQMFQSMIMELLEAIKTGGTGGATTCAPGTVAQYGPDGAMICVPDGSSISQCPAGFLLDPATGQCVESYGPSQGCPPGYVQDMNGQCVPQQGGLPYDPYNQQPYMPGYGVTQPYTGGPSVEPIDQSGGMIDTGMTPGFDVGGGGGGDLMLPQQDISVNPSMPSMMPSGGGMPAMPTTDAYSFDTGDVFGGGMDMTEVAQAELSMPSPMPAPMMQQQIPVFQPQAPSYPAFDQGMPMDMVQTEQMEMMQPMQPMMQPALPMPQQQQAMPLMTPQAQESMMLPAPQPGVMETQSMPSPLDAEIVQMPSDEQMPNEQASDTESVLADAYESTGGMDVEN